jgi:hypothetical protein
VLKLLECRHPLFKTVVFLTKSSQDYLVADPGLEERDDVLDSIAEKRAATSICQSAEWGMRAVQASFPHLKDTLPYEENGERRMILTCLFLLYNCRARLVGINQIASVYLPYLENDANSATAVSNVLTIHIT